MTTIVANLECMAADQRVTGDGPICHAKKMHRVGNSIFGLAGDVMAGLAVIEWLRTPKRNRAHLYKMFGEGVEWRYEFVLLELSEDGLALWNAWGVRLPILDKTYGIGTGSQAALAALDSGHTPEDAIRKAIRRDEYSGLLTDPEVEWLLPPELKRRR
jgi:hypothetical protein